MTKVWESITQNSHGVSIECRVLGSGGVMVLLPGTSDAVIVQPGEQFTLAVQRLDSGLWGTKTTVTHDR